MDNSGIPRLQVPRFYNDGSIIGGIMDGRAYMTNEQITNDAIREHKEELAKAKAEDEMMRRSLFGNGNKNQTTPQFNLGEGIGFNENGQYRIPAQLTINPFGVDTSGWETPTGNSINVGSFDTPNNIGEGIVADRNGWRGIPQQQTTNPFGIDTSGLGNPSGNSINVGSFDTPKQNAWTTAFEGVKSFNQPSADNQLAHAVEGLGTNPNYMSIMSNGLMTPQQLLKFNEKMNLRQWLEWDAKMNGVTDPLIALARYNKFMPTMQKQAELEELRNAYYIMNSDPNDKRFTPEQRLNARTLVEFDKKNPYYVDDHDMNVEKFGWARQNFENEQKMFPLKLEKAQLGTLLQRQQLDANELANTGEYAGVNLEGDSWYRKNDGVDLSNLQGRALAGLNHASVIFKSMFGEPLMVTSGRDSDAHMGGQYSHYTGWKVDVSSGMNSKRLEDPQERAKFIQALGSVGIIVNDEWAKDKHLDLNFQNYHGNYTKNRNRNSQTSSINYNDPFDAKAFSNAAYLWGGGADGKSKPNAELAKVLATKFVKDYVDALKKNGGNPQRAINTVQEIIKKDKQIAGPIEGNPMFDKLIFSIAYEAALIANGQGGQAVLMPTELSQTTKTDKPTNLGGWGAKVGNDNPSDRSKRDKSLDAIDNAELDENRIGMYNLDGYGQIPDALDLNKLTGTRSYYESLLKYFGSGT